MSASAFDTAKLSTLLHDLHNGQLQSDDAAWLRTTLLAHEEARRLYVESVWLVGAMHWMLHGSLAQAVGAAKPASRSISVPVATVEAARRGGLIRWRQLVGAAAVGVVSLAIYLVFVTWGILDVEQAGGGRLEAGGTQVATITGSVDAKWLTEDAAASNQQLEIRNQKSEITSGQPLALAGGTVEVKLQKGVRLLVEGPARWTIDGENRATLLHGKLLASVPPSAVGFTVTTPTAKVVDLGTEFGVTVDQQGRTRARVFQGEVKLRASSPDFGLANGPAATRLTAGQAVRIDAAGTITPVQPEFATADKFIRPPKSTDPSAAPTGAFELPSAYSRAVLNTPGLVGYWRLGEDGSQGARDELEVSHAHPLGRSGGLYAKFHQDDFRRPGAVVGQPSYGVHFNGESYLEIDDTPALEGDWEGLTLAAWIQPDLWQAQSPDSTALIVGKWAPDAEGSAYGLFYNYSRKLELAICSQGSPPQASELKPQDTSLMTAHRLVGAGNVAIHFDRYQFVVGTWDKATGDCHLYVNGQADAAHSKQPPPIGLNSKPYMPLSIGSQIADKSRYFTGLMDEVSVFNRALSADEIEQLYRHATAKTES